MNWEPATDEEMRELGLEPGPGGSWRSIKDSSKEHPASAVPLLDAVDAVVDDRVDGVHLTSLTDVQMQRARFAWEDRIPLGTITLIAGVPGQGKSTLTAHLGARITRGQLAGDLYGKPADVVIASAEDALAFVLQPRFVAAGADLSRVHSIAVGREGTDVGIAIPDDLEGIRRALLQTEARLLVIDPLLAHIPMRIDGYKDQHVRTALAPLAKMAEELGVAVVCVMHLNKRESADLFLRIGGSGGFVGAARSALLVAPDPNESDLRIVAHGKSNLCPEAASLAFRLEGCELPNPDPDDEEPIRVASVAMMGESDLGIANLLDARHPSTKTDATIWLAQYLRDGPRPHHDVEDAAREAGFAWRTVERAKKDLGARSEHVGVPGTKGFWQWALP